MLYTSIEKYITSLNTASIPKERKEVLQPLVDYMRSKVDISAPIALNFVCTHNSRRSHLAQIWAQTIGAHFEINDLACYSGGTEATAVYPMVIHTLKNIGFQITDDSAADNPRYNIKFGEHDAPVIGFSKKYDAPFNPTSRFAAVMTCDHADENCPFIPGAERRIPVTYIDPKISDGMPEQEATYFERSEQIATEMKYVFNHLV
ncbi:MAG: protein-tyrosine-phosphatase [Balneolaceae bacterium]